MDKMDGENAQSKGEHYNLRWTNYHNNLSQILLEHHLNEKLIDVTLVCDGQYIKAHKLVLSACSNYFQDLFRRNSCLDQQWSGIIHPFIIMNGVQFNHLKHIVDFMYQGEIKVIDSDLEGVLALGESLRVKGLCSVKLRQKIGLNEPKSLERSNSPLTNQQRKQAALVEPKNTSDNMKNSLKVPSLTTSLPSEDMNISEEEPKNYSKVTLDALEENKPVTTNVNNGIKERKNESLIRERSEEHLIKERISEEHKERSPSEETVRERRTDSLIRDRKSEERGLIRDPPLTGHPIRLTNDEEPKFKKFKGTPPPLVLRKFEKLSPKSSSVEEDPMSSDNTKPVIVDADKSNLEKKNEIPRPPNAFMIFATEMRKKLAVEHPDESSKDISIRLGHLWKTLCPETKETYYQAAQTALREHELKYPQGLVKPPPVKMKKIYVANFAKTKSSGPSTESKTEQGGDNDLEIIEPDTSPTIIPDTS